MTEGTALRFDLTDLRLFLAVVEQGSLTKGASAVNLSLASVSERVSGMESALGAPLLERGRRGVRPTAAGDALTHHARVILNQVEQMRGELRTYATGLKGRIRLLSNTAAFAAILPRQLQRFLTAYPDLSIDLSEWPSAEIVPALADGRADLGIVADIADMAVLQTLLLAQDRLVVLAGKRHRFGGKKSVAFADVLSEPMIGVSDTALETYLGERAARVGRHINYRVQLRSLQDVGMLVEADVGIAILSEVSADKLRRPRLVTVPLSDPWALRQLYLCARNFSQLTPQARLLVQQFTNTEFNAE